MTTYVTEITPVSPVSSAIIAMSSDATIAAGLNSGVISIYSLPTWTVLDTINVSSHLSVTKIVLSGDGSRLGFFVPGSTNYAGTGYLYKRGFSGSYPTPVIPPVTPGQENKWNLEISIPRMSAKFNISTNGTSIIGCKYSQNDGNASFFIFTRMNDGVQLMWNWYERYVQSTDIFLAVSGDGNSGVMADRPGAKIVLVKGMGSNGSGGFNAITSFVTTLTGSLTSIASLSYDGNRCIFNVNQTLYKSSYTANSWTTPTLATLMSQQIDFILNNDGNTAFILSNDGIRTVLFIGGTAILILSFSTSVSPTRRFSISYKGTEMVYTNPATGQFQYYAALAPSRSIIYNITNSGSCDIELLLNGTPESVTVTDNTPTIIPYPTGEYELISIAPIPADADATFSLVERPFVEFTYDLTYVPNVDLVFNTNYVGDGASEIIVDGIGSQEVSASDPSVTFANFKVYDTLGQLNTTTWTAGAPLEPPNGIIGTENIFTLVMTIFINWTIGYDRPLMVATVTDLPELPENVGPVFNWKDENNDYHYFIPDPSNPSRFTYEHTIAGQYTIEAGLSGSPPNIHMDPTEQDLDIEATITWTLTYDQDNNQLVVTVSEYTPDEYTVNFVEEFTGNPFIWDADRLHARLVLSEPGDVVVNVSTVTNPYVTVVDDFKSITIVNWSVGYNSSTGNFFIDVTSNHNTYGIKYSVDGVIVENPDWNISNRAFYTPPYAGKYTFNVLSDDTEVVFVPNTAIESTKPLVVGWSATSKLGIITVTTDENYREDFQINFEINEVPLEWNPENGSIANSTVLTVGDHTVVGVLPNPPEDYSFITFDPPSLDVYVKQQITWSFLVNDGTFTIMVWDSDDTIMEHLSFTANGDEFAKDIPNRQFTIQAPTYGLNEIVGTFDTIGNDIYELVPVSQTINYYNFEWEVVAENGYLIVTITNDLQIDPREYGVLFSVDEVPFIWDEGSNTVARLEVGLGEFLVMTSFTEVTNLFIEFTPEQQNITSTLTVNWDLEYHENGLFQITVDQDREQYNIGFNVNETPVILTWTDAFTATVALPPGELVFEGTANQYVNFNPPTMTVNLKEITWEFTNNDDGTFIVDIQEDHTINNIRFYVDGVLIPWISETQARVDGLSDGSYEITATADGYIIFNPPSLNAIITRTVLWTASVDNDIISVGINFNRTGYDIVFETGGVPFNWVNQILATLTVGNGNHIIIPQPNELLRFEPASQTVYVPTVNWFLELSGNNFRVYLTSGNHETYDITFYADDQPFDWVGSDVAKLTMTRGGLYTITPSSDNPDVVFNPTSFEQEFIVSVEWTIRYEDNTVIIDIPNNYEDYDISFRFNNIPMFWNDNFTQATLPFIIPGTYTADILSPHNPYVDLIPTSRNFEVPDEDFDFDWSMSYEDGNIVVTALDNYEWYGVSFSVNTGNELIPLEWDSDYKHARAFLSPQDRRAGIYTVSGLGPQNVNFLPENNTFNIPAITLDWTYEYDEVGDILTVTVLENQAAYGLIATFGGDSMDWISETEAIIFINIPGARQLDITGPPNVMFNPDLPTNINIPGDAIHISWTMSYENGYVVIECLDHLSYHNFNFVIGTTTIGWPQSGVASIEYRYPGIHNIIPVVNDSSQSFNFSPESDTLDIPNIVVNWTAGYAITSIYAIMTANYAQYQTVIKIGTETMDWNDINTAVFTETVPGTYELIPETTIPGITYYPTRQNVIIAGTYWTVAYSNGIVTVDCPQRETGDDFKFLIDDEVSLIWETTTHAVVEYREPGIHIVTPRIMNPLQSFTFSPASATINIPVYWTVEYINNQIHVSMPNNEYETTIPINGTTMTWIQEYSEAVYDTTEPGTYTLIPESTDSDILYDPVQQDIIVPVKINWTVAYEQNKIVVRVPQNEPEYDINFIVNGELLDWDVGNKIASKVFTIPGLQTVIGTTQYPNRVIIIDPSKEIDVPQITVEWTAGYIDTPFSGIAIESSNNHPFNNVTIDINNIQVPWITGLDDRVAFYYTSTPAVYEVILSTPNQNVTFSPETQEVIISTVIEWTLTYDNSTHMITVYAPTNVVNNNAVFRINNVDLEWNGTQTIAQMEITTPGDYTITTHSPYQYITFSPEMREFTVPDEPTVIEWTVEQINAEIVISAPGNVADNNVTFKLNDLTFIWDTDYQHARLSFNTPGLYIIIGTSTQVTVSPHSRDINIYPVSIKVKDIITTRNSINTLNVTFSPPTATYQIIIPSVSAPYISLTNSNKILVNGDAPFGVHTLNAILTNQDQMEITSFKVRVSDNNTQNIAILAASFLSLLFLTVASDK